MTPDVGGKPETIKPDGDEFEQRAACHQPAKFTTFPGKCRRSRQRRRRPDHLIHRSIP
jgi:hypothetical protein